MRSSLWGRLMQLPGFAVGIYGPTAGMSGPDLQQELMRRRQDIPIVFVTAQRDERVRPRLLAQGAVECLSKPFSDAALLRALNAAFRVI
jgi:FixJ family two-component response regulator